MVTLYVEGGGDRKPLKTECREAFTSFMKKAGVSLLPRVVACGGRQDAYNRFCIAVGNGEDALILVDSEAPVAPVNQQGKPEKWKPWAHLKARDGDRWEKPDGAPNTDCHLMVQCMESWLIADPATLKTFFGQGFRDNQLPATANSVESVAKTQVYNALAKATKNCKTKAQYGKGEHSFKLLGNIDPAKVMAALPWARRFVSELKKKMAG